MAVSLSSSSSSSPPKSSDFDFKAFETTFLADSVSVNMDRLFEANLE
jgi:hypothetical protein